MVRVDLNDIAPDYQIQNQGQTIDHEDVHKCLLEFKRIEEVESWPGK
jgi:hypothetical protein